MKYMGSKNRHAKELLPIILKDRKPGQWYVEPFVGGANMIDKVVGNRIGGDYNKYLVALLKSLQEGWLPPDYVSEEEWKLVREQMDMSYPLHYIAFVRFGCSFGADWNGGFARNVRKDKPNAEILNKTSKSYCGQSKRNMLKQVPNLKGIVFENRSFDKLEIPRNSIIYCDPPYAGTTKYATGGFDHVAFWRWCRDKVAEGHQVFVSEYNAPDDWTCVWEKKTSANFDVNRDGASERIEKLFVYKEN